jgi:hypothetical protein
LSEDGNFGQIWQWAHYPKYPNPKMTFKNKEDKTYIYHLISQYIDNQISLEHFSEKYFNCYSKFLDYDTLTKIERELFKDLSIVSSRYTEHLDDLIKYPGTYFSKNDLDEKVRIIADILGIS